MKNFEYLIKENKNMLQSGFEPESSAREAEMIGRTTLLEHPILKNEKFYLNITHLIY